MVRFSRRFLFLLCIGVGVLCWQSASQTVSKSPAEKPDYSKEAAVLEQVTTKMAFENDGSSTRQSASRVRIQSEAAVQNFGVLTFPYQSAYETFEIDYVRVIKPDGTAVATPMDDMQDMPSEITRQAPFYSDSREKHVAVKGLSVGDTLEFAGHASTKAFAPGQFWYGYNFSRDTITLNEVLEISVPKRRAIKWRSPGNTPAITVSGDRQVFTWTSSHLQQKSPEEEKKDQEQKTYELGRGRLPAPEVQLSSFQSWEEVAAWYSNLQAERVKPSPEIVAKAAELTKNAPDDDAKVRALYTYVSTQFRYIGIAFGVGRYQPHAAADVLANQYGDCKDKHTLLASLLEAAGIKAYPALINSSHEMSLDVPSPQQFDHVITAVPRGNSFLWVDTTTEVAPFGYLMSVLRGKAALVIPPDKPAALASTPADPPQHPTETFSIDAKLSDDGTLEGKMEQSATALDAEVILRLAFRRVPMTQWKDLAQGMARAEGYAGDVSNVIASSPEKTEEPFRLSYNYTRKDFPDWQNRRIAIALPPILLPQTDTKPSDPVWLGSPQEFHYQSRIQLPKGYSPELPDNVNLIQDFAEYHTTYSAKGDVLISEHRLITKQSQVALAEYDAYKNFAKKVAADYDIYVSLAVTNSPTPARNARQQAFSNLPLSDNADAIRAYNDATEKMKSNDMPGAIESLKAAAHADPKFVRVWLMLGDTYLFLMKDKDAALDTLRKGYAANPDEPLISKELVSVLMAQEKYEDAVAVLRERAKANPQNTETLSALAGALSSNKQYSEAAETMKSALALEPDKARFYAELGSIYLKAKDEEKSSEAFKKALALDPRPVMYNDIAYMMADAEKNLPLSLEWAQKAVREEEEASAKVQLSTLKLEDLGPTSSLAAFWDTLGWVYFRMKNYDLAEKYLNAAWSLAPAEVIGEHLGQAYEDNHKVKLALQTYQMALYRLRLRGTNGPSATRLTAKIQKISGGQPTNNAMASSDGLNQLRTFKLPRVIAGTASADFLVRLGSEGKIDDVKFVSGSEELKNAAKAMNAAAIRFPFPDNGPSRLVRRGIVSCFLHSGCTLVLYNLEDVKSVD